MNNKTLKYFENWLYPGPFQASLLIVLILSLLALSWVIVYVTGGTSFAYLHIFYIPIICGGFFFSIYGGLLTAVIAGLLVGPLMPLDVAGQIQQPAYSWIARLIFFVLVGFTSGLTSALFRQYLKELKERYTTNPITGLPNFQGLEAIFQGVVDKKQSAGVILLDINNLGEIELAIGPSGVEALMKQITKELTGILPSDVTIGQSQSSGFVLIVHDISKSESIANHCYEHLQSSYEINEIPIFVEKYFGIVRYPQDDSSFTGLIRKARMTVTKSILQIQYIGQYDENIVETEGENVTLLNDLNTALTENALQVFYQPKVNLKTGVVTGVEALARWFHPVKGEIRPDRFIPLTERTLLINPFTQWLLKRAFTDLSNWISNDIDVGLAINFSMKNFHDSATLAKISELIEEFGIDPKKIEIEITESAVSADLTQVINASNYLRSKGIKVSIDDFGTGMASQQYLLELPIDALKIDRIFIKDIDKSPAARAIVQSAISLGHQLNLEVIAEGVETEQQYHMLKQMGCDLIQGYLIAKPMPYVEFINWLKIYNKKNVV